MKIEFTHKFIKIFKNRISSHKSVYKKFDERVLLFSKDHKDPLLKDHELKGDFDGYRSFSITGDIRVIYYVRII